jgi:hypothetical protein
MKTNYLKIKVKIGNSYLWLKQIQWGTSPINKVFVTNQDDGGYFFPDQIEKLRSELVNIEVYYWDSDLHELVPINN